MMPKASWILMADELQSSIRHHLGCVFRAVNGRATVHWHASSGIRGLAGLFFSSLLIFGGTAEAETPIEFNRDIRPILSDNCFACHGPDEKTRQAGLRLDLADASRGKLASGKFAIIPGKVIESELTRRIGSHDPQEKMPPVDSGKRLNASQIELLNRWVLQGAEYQQHWSLIAPKRPHIDPAEIEEALSPIDVLIRQQLKQVGLTPSPPADKERLIRRLTLDLTGTPPALDELDDFLADSSPDASEKVVDRLLASPRYGERLTLDWLDAARFADTHGFNNDSTRSMWRWRDWTINAFNANMPYDQFVTEQLAGDLLPNSTLDQQIATGFNRNHVINSEGGIIPEEYRVEYVADRVHTTATVFLGLSMGCARCHDHKFDPITQREFYQFFAFFNQLDEKGEAGRRGNAEPMIQAPTPIQSGQITMLALELERLNQSLRQKVDAAIASTVEWEPKLNESARPNPGTPTPLLRFALNEANDDQIVDQYDSQRKVTVVGKISHAPGKLQSGVKLEGGSHLNAGGVASFDRTDRFSIAAWINYEKQEKRDTVTVLARMDHSDEHRGIDLQIVRGKLTAHLIHKSPDEMLHVVSKTDLPPNQWKHVMVTYDGSLAAAGLKLYVDGALQDAEIKTDKLTGSTATTANLLVGRRSSGENRRMDEAPFRGVIDDVRIYDRDLTSDQVRALYADDGALDLLAIDAPQRNADQASLLARIYLSRFDDSYRDMERRRVEAETQKAEIEKIVPSAMVMREMAEPRKTFILKRGQYDAPTEEVLPGVPASLPLFPPTAPRNRLGLAQWLLLPDHPLTSRVAVNRSWALFFGTGLVETVEDFGSQGQWPSHLDLLDWLSVEFSGADADFHAANQSRPVWDIKRLHRMIVTSATYRQSSRATGEAFERDPANKLLARGPRFRLPAELIRDNALAIAGLLCDHPGGPSVSPYQPANLWDDVAVGADYEGTVYKQDQGESLYRRSMYTFWKRTCPPPGLNTFDAPEREFCLARRSRTNTPLQALVLLNDPTYLEASRKLAERVILFGGTTSESRVSLAFRLSLSRKPTAAESTVLVKTYEQRLARFRTDPASARSLISIGESPRDEMIDDAELAAWSSIMSLILNLDETITKG